MGKLSKRSLQLFFKVCYNLDTFRSFVASENFTKLYDLPADEMEKLLDNNSALMLFGENTIALKHEAAEKRRGRVQQMAQQIEREAQEKRASEQDDMYQGS